MKYPLLDCKVQWISCSESMNSFSSWCLNVFPLRSSPTFPPLPYSFGFISLLNFTLVSTPFAVTFLFTNFVFLKNVLSGKSKPPRPGTNVLTEKVKFWYFCSKLTDEYQTCPNSGSSVLDRRHLRCSLCMLILLPALPVVDFFIYIFMLERVNKIEWKKQVKINAFSSVKYSNFS